MSGPQRLKLLVWQIRHDCHPTASLYYDKNLAEDVGCSICNDPVEDCLHALCNCTHARAIWQRLLPSELQTQFFGSPTAEEWFYGNLDGSFGEHIYRLEWKHVFREAVHTV